MTVTITEGLENSNTDQTVMMTLTSTYTLGTSPATTSPITTQNNAKTVTAAQQLFDNNETTVTVANSPQQSTVYVSQALTVSASLVGQVIITQPVTNVYPTTSRQETTFLTSYTSSAQPKSRSSSSTIASTETSTSVSDDLSSSLTNSSSNSLRLGLTIGLPVAIVSLFIILILAFIFLKKNKFKNTRQQMMPYKSQFFSYLDNDDGNAGNDLEDKDGDASVLPIRRNYSSSPILNLQQQARNNNRKSIGIKIRDRISKVIDFGHQNGDHGGDEVDSYYRQQPVGASFRNSIMSPTFLKRFNLSKPPPPVVLRNRELSTDSTPIESKFLSYPYTESAAGSHRSKQQHKRNFSIPPVVAPVSHDNSLDPIQGGISNSPQFKDKLYMVVKPYTKNLHDELTIKVGNKMIILAEHSDGWCKAKMVRKGNDYYKNLASSDEGMVPKVCLQRI